jgi:hypothetical protein
MAEDTYNHPQWFWVLPIIGVIGVRHYMVLGCENNSTPSFPWNLDFLSRSPGIKFYVPHAYEPPKFSNIHVTAEPGYRDQLHITSISECSYSKAMSRVE